MPSSRDIVLLLALAASAAGAQDAGMLRGLDLEAAGKPREAATAFRGALRDGNPIPALLGLERVYAELGWGDSLLPVLDSLIGARPRDATVRTVQLRTLRSLGREEEARQAFERWASEVPRDAAPYREYARQLLQDGRAGGADSVLQRAMRSLGGASELAPELAQLRAQMGRWVPAARSWRSALEPASYLTPAAVYSLAGAPVAARDSIRAVLLEPPDRLAARRLLAGLELQWGAGRSGWRALASLPAGDSAAQAWRDFAEQAENAQEWLASRDAMEAVIAWRPDPALAVRAAENALRGGDPLSASKLADVALARPDSSSLIRRAVTVRVRALAELGRAEEAASVLERHAGILDPMSRAQAQRAAAWGWVRRGDVARARAALRSAGADSTDDGGAEGWLALYEGDLAGARAALRRGDATPDRVAALALLARTKASRSAEVGKAFLALARGDSSTAASSLEAAARELVDAEPLLLALAARVHAGRGAADKSVALWEMVASRHGGSPEAAEADLEWARALRRSGRDAEAVARLEHMILTYPESALVPQARYELEMARGRLPRP